MSTLRNILEGDKENAERVLANIKKEHDNS